MISLACGILVAEKSKKKKKLACLEKFIEKSGPLISFKFLPLI